VYDVCQRLLVNLRMTALAQRTGHEGLCWHEQVRFNLALCRDRSAIPDLLTFRRTDLAPGRW
jgi:hypothetical protein